MPWLVGIDEAGYGPNLGPLVMSAAACAIPDRDGDANLWRLLRSAVRKCTDRADGRLVVADSKQVYSPARGLGLLETSVLAALHVSLNADGDLPADLKLRSLMELVCPAGLRETLQPELDAELWYDGRTPLPVAVDRTELEHAIERLREACRRRGVSMPLCRSVVVCPPRFNDLTDTCDSKAAALAFGLTHLLRECIEAAPVGEPIAFLIDKHGGRNQYAPILSAALPGAFVWGRTEGAERSIYDVQGLDRLVRVTVQPRADAEHFPVALASMVSKYLREVLMGEFNAFWRRHVADLAPTAGYPTDAVRFFEQIRSAMATLGLTERQVWRRK